MRNHPLSHIEIHFGNLTDPRGPNIEHLLFDIVAIATLVSIQKLLP